MTGSHPPLRVCYYDHCAQLGGAEIALLRVLEHQPDGATVVLGQPGRLAELLNERGVRVIVRPLPWRSQAVRRDTSPLNLVGTVLMVLGMAGYVVRLAAWLRGDRPDVVHLNSLRGALIGGVAARLAGIPVVWHAHDSIDESYLPKPVVQVIRGMVRTIPAAVVANSHWTLSTLRLPKRFFATHPVAVIPPPLPTRASVPAPRRDDNRPDVRPDQREDHGADRHENTGGVTILMVGRLAPWKGQDLVLDALAQVRDLPWRMRFAGSALFGEDDYAAQLSQQATDLGLADRITFVPFAEDVTGEYQRAQVLIHFSRSPEPFGMVVTEGLSHGLAVIAADAGGPSEVIDDGHNGLLVTPGDAGQLAATMRRLLADAELRQCLGQRARQGLDGFRPASVGKQLAAVHARVVQSGRLPARSLVHRFAGSIRRDGAARPTSSITHIGIASSAATPGGLNRFVDDLVAAQSYSRTVRMIRLPAIAGGKVARWRQIRRQFDQSLPQTRIFDCHFAYYALPGLLRFRRMSAGSGPGLGRPMVVHFHGPWAAESAAMGANPAIVWVKQAVERWVFRRAQEFVTLTDDFKQTLIEDYRVPAARIHVIPPGVDTGRFHAIGSRSHARELLGLPVPGPLVVAVRRLVPRMGLSDLIQCVADLPGVHLAIAGEGPQREELGRLALRIAPGRVHFLGRLPEAELPLAYRAADVSVVPSRELEGFGLVALESLACGTPVVARPQGGLRTALAGMPEMLARGMGVSDLRDAIAAALEHPPSEAACLAYAATWSWDRTLDRLDDVYDLATQRFATESDLPLAVPAGSRTS